MRLLVVGPGSLSTSLLHGLSHLFARASIISLPDEKTRNHQELLVLAKRERADVVVISEIAQPLQVETKLPELREIISSMELVEPVFIEDNRRRNNSGNDYRREKQNSARIRTMLKQQKTKIPRR